MNQEDIKDFVENYFKNLGAIIDWNGEVIQISQVPEEFERFVGKKSPYKIGFDESHKSDGIELLSTDSYFLKAMRDYIKEKGKTTLIKLAFDDVLEKGLKMDVVLKNCEAVNQIVRNELELIKKFTFQISLQYLNQREDIIKDIHVKDNKIIQFDLAKYKTKEGRKEEIVFGNVKEDYELAKNEIKNDLKDIVEKTALKLEKKLNKEIERINSHHNSQISEITAKISKNTEKIEALRKEFNKEHKESILQKIQKFEERNSQLKEELNSEKLEKEKEFLIKDERRKHSLDISTKLINTTLVYYPIFNIKTYLKNKKSQGEIIVKYDPVNKIKSDLLCSSCSQKLIKLYLCSSGHISCHNCIKKCSTCQSEICKTCHIEKCNICRRETCRFCSAKCETCRKNVCKTHINRDPIHEKKACTDCTKFCSSCSKYYIKNFFTKDKSGRMVCKKCLSGKKISSIFSS